ncbi:MAG: Hsp20/alpha crystallin family protein, partial [Candidatus Bathyarchaeota archaeon]|nr:Hsp20/alpha crystallin family protein [Candidatus Bathyarchaeota archaeon]
VEEDRVRTIAELPGVELEDINLKVSSWEIIISAEHGNIRYYRRLVLPTMVVPKVEEISYTNGVLAFSLYRSM